LRGEELQSASHSRITSAGFQPINLSPIYGAGQEHQKWTESGEIGLKSKD